MVQGRLTYTDTPTIQMGATPSGLTSVHLYPPHIFLQAGCPSCCPSNSVKALKAHKNNKKFNQAGFARDDKYIYYHNI